MAKKRPAAKASAKATQSPASDFDDAVEAVCRVTGRGVIPARQQVKRLDPEVVKQLAACHRKQDYREAISKLYR